MRSLFGSAVLCGFQLLCEPLAAEDESSVAVGKPAKLFIVNDSSSPDVVDVVFQGLESTKRDVLMDLLPRALPAPLTDAEVSEFARRIKNLGIFESVDVEREHGRLKVVLSRKRTMSPIIDFSTGKTWKDSSATLGVSEYDFLGEGTRLGGKVSYAERSLNFAAWIEEHAYSPNRWAKEYEAYRFSSSFRFADNDGTYTRNRLGGFAEWISPFHYGSHILYEFQLVSYYEDYSDVTDITSPEDGIFLGGLFEIIYDRYKWDDLHPDGYKLVMELRPGAMVNGRFRGEARFKALAATPLFEKATLVFNGNMAAVNSGDVNHSVLVGSQQGVRGLSDSFYRSSAVAYLNTEMRYAIHMGNRFFFQPVLFVDIGTFEPMDSAGERQSWEDALSTGAGLRIVPTRLTNLLLRADAAKLHTPTDEWLVQIGITQYF